MSERDFGLGPPLDEEGVARVWRRISDARTARRRPRPLVWMAVASAAAAVAAAVWLVHPFGRPGALAGGSVQVTAGTALTAPESPATLPLSDGSRLELARGATMDVLANDGERFVTLLKRGRAHFDVRPGGPRRWTIETDLATVEVVGTAFTVDRDPHRLEVTVDRGVVMVRGERVPGRVQRLTAGQKLEVAGDLAATATAPAAPAPAAPATALAPAPVPAPAAMPATVAAGSPQPRRAAAAPAPRAGAPAAPASPLRGPRGDVAMAPPATPPAASPQAAARAIAAAPVWTPAAPPPDATHAPEVAAAAPPAPPAALPSHASAAAAPRSRGSVAAPPPDPPPAPPDNPARPPAPPPEALPVREAIARAAALRAGHEPGRAAGLLATALAASPDDPLAGLASFALGRIELDDLHHPGRAAAAFARVIALGSPRALLEDAHVRRIEALRAAGRDDEARAAARAYRGAFPDGERAADVRALMGEP